MNKRMTAVVEEKPIAQWKREEVDELNRLIAEWNVVGIVNLEGVRAVQVQELRKKFRDELVFRCARKRIFQRVLDAAKNKPNIAELEKHLAGPNLYLFTNLEPVKVSLLFKKNRIKVAAKVGDIAQMDIVIPAGNTGLPPGPIISEFTEMEIPTKIETGSVWVTLDTVVVKKGEAISMKLASMLSTLGLKPMEAGLTLSAAYHAGLVYDASVLHIDLDAVRADIEAAYSNAFNMAFNAGLFLPETIPLLLAKAAGEGISLASNVTGLEAELVGSTLSKAHMEAKALENELATKGV
ncbi:MAG: 50S ribosomal protein L10 [Candidatus Bathyarchaeia archaeon]